MKKFLSLVLALVMTMSLVTISAGAEDFADDDTIDYKEAVDVISAIGIVDGYSDDSFRPDGALTRGAAAKIICNLILGPTTASALRATTAPFKDVPTTNTFAGYITYCAQQGIINGYGDGTFRPTGTLTGNAFMKMLLGALGYSSSKEGYTGSNWQINVIKQAVNIGLDDGNDEFAGSNAVTRQEAALYAFNMLQADLVEYPDDTIITAGDVTVTTQGTYKSVQWGSSADEDGNIDDDGYVQFAERYFNKLVKKADTDDFARPATTWVNDGDKIGTYVDDADVSYTSNVTLGTIYSDLGLSQPDKNAEVYYNGVRADDVSVSRNNDRKISSSFANDKLVGDGTIVDVYYTGSTNDVTICVVDVYVGTISSINSKAADPYVVVNPECKITEKDGTTTVNINGTKARFETDTSDFDEDDVVLFTYSQSADEIKSVEVAESVEGTLDKYTLNKTLTLGDTEYKYAKNISFSAIGDQSSMTTKSDYIVYLDANGLAIYVDEQEFDPSQYAFVLYTQSSNSRFGKDQVQLVMSDGKVKTVDTDDDYTSLEGTIVYYRADANGEYSLRKAANVHENADNISVTADTDIKTSGVLSGGSTTFKMQNTRAAITTDGTDVVYGNSETVFVVAETNATTGKTDYSVYTGIKNAPTIMSDNPTTTPTVETNAVEMVYTTSGTSDVVTFAFIDATNAYVTNGKHDVVFLAGESVTNLITDSNNNQYYLYNAVVDDEITTVMVKATQNGGSAVVAGSDNNMVVTNADYNNKNLLVSADAISSNDYDTLRGTAVWKLSGSYSIGLGGTTASASSRETVASDAKMFYVDTDGVITKIDDVKDINSDSTAQYIALRDTSEGDIAYLFIQEVDNGKNEGAAGSSNYSISGITYNGTSTLTVTLKSALSVNVTVPVTIYEINGGSRVSLGTYDVTVPAHSTTGTVNIGALNGGYTHLAISGNFTAGI